MSMTREDKVYFDGWKDGYDHAIEDIRNELLTNEKVIDIEVFEILNKIKEAKWL